MNLRSFKGFGALLLLTLAAPIFSGAQSICPNPDKPCRGFKPYELPFRIPPSNTARAEDTSADFYAIILKSSPPCSIPDNERISAQKLFPQNKVFVSRFECEGEDTIKYSSIDSTKYSILAVYAGASKRQADGFLVRVRKTGRFPDAYLKRMKVVLVHP